MVGFLVQQHSPFPEALELFMLYLVQYHMVHVYMYPSAIVNLYFHYSEIIPTLLGLLLPYMKA